MNVTAKLDASCQGGLTIFFADEPYAPGNGSASIHRLDAQAE